MADSRTDAVVVNDGNRVENYTTGSTAELDLQNRYEQEGLIEVDRGEDGEDNGNRAASTGGAGPEGRNFAVEDNDTSNYVGVSPEYMTYANEYDAPLEADGGVEAVAEAKFKNPDNYPLGTLESRTPGQTAGGGSSTPHIVVTTSGESIQHTLVEEAPEADKETGEVHPDTDSEGPKSKTTRKNTQSKPAEENLDGGQTL